MNELVERLRREAQQHAGEARTANSTIYEIYQLISGGKGEPGNWHGAEPVREYIADAAARISDLQAEVERLRGALKPFATAADDAERLVGHDGPMGQYIAYDALCAARAALGPKP